MKLVKGKKFLGEELVKEVEVGEEIGERVEGWGGVGVVEVGGGMGVVRE